MPFTLGSNIDVGINEGHTVSNIAASSCSAKPDAKFITTGLSVEDVQKREAGILERIERNVGFTIAGGIGTLIPQDEVGQANVLPLVVLINGAGGGGKDTFIDFVGKYTTAYNLSSINEIKHVAKQLVYFTDVYNDLEGVHAKDEMDAKTDKYRQFLHQLKMAWSNFNDGPNVRLLGELRDVLSKQMSGQEIYSMVFMHVREKDEIATLKNRIENEFGLPVITMLVKGITSPSDYTNDCDRNVEEYVHDITVINKPNHLFELELQAYAFAKAASAANMGFGYPAYKCLATGTTANGPIITDKAYRAETCSITGASDSNVPVTTYNTETQETNHGTPEEVKPAKFKIVYNDRSPIEPIVPEPTMYSHDRANPVMERIFNQTLNDPTINDNTKEFIKKQMESMGIDVYGDQQGTDIGVVDPNCLD